MEERESWRLEASKGRFRGGRGPWRKEIVWREISEARVHGEGYSYRRESLELGFVGFVG